MDWMNETNTGLFESILSQARSAGQSVDEFLRSNLSEEDVSKILEKFPSLSSEDYDLAMSDTYDQIAKGLIDEHLMKRITNLGLVTFAYHKFLRSLSPEEIVITYPEFFKRDAEALTMLLWNHIFRKDLFENPKDLNFLPRVLDRLNKLKEGADGSQRDSLEQVIEDAEQYSEYARTNANHGSFTLGHHQLLPAFAFPHKEALLLEYATGAGKTYAAMQALKTLTEQNPDEKILIIPKLSSITEGTWTEESLKRFGIEARVDVLNRKGRTENPHILVVNYEKLLESNVYADEVRAFAGICDDVIVDEGHNLRNARGKISRSAQKIITSNSRRRLILTATPYYNGEQDLGMIMFLCDPKRYAMYGVNGKEGRIKFSHKLRGELISLMEIRENNWWVFNQDAVTKFHNLPKFSERRMDVTMHSEDAQRYFSAYQDAISCMEPNKLMGKTKKLEEAIIYGLINSDEFLQVVRNYLNRGYVVNFFSPLINGIFERLEERLSPFVAPERLAKIYGKIGYSSRDNERARIQQRLKDGSIDVLINQWNCAGEAFSEVAGSRPVLIVPLIPPYAPGRKVQIVGRPYRPNQLAPVELLFMIPQSKELKEQTVAYIRSLVKGGDVLIRDSWEETNIAEDAYITINNKEGNRDKITGAVDGNVDENVEGIDTTFDVINKRKKELGIIGAFKTRRSIIQRPIKPGSCDFFAGTIALVGKPYDPDNFDDTLVKEYSRPDMLLTKSGAINLALATRVSELASTNESRTIADYGCCTSVFAQARLFVQALEQAITGRQSADQIINIDGNANGLGYGKTILKDGTWLSCLKNLGRINPNLNDQALQILHNPESYERFLKELSFVHGNFTQRLNQVPDQSVDVAILSQALQYNCQSPKRDVERIAVNINKALVPGGDLIVYLVGNPSVKRSITRRSDISNLCKVLGAYGLEVVEQETIAPVLEIKGREIELPEIVRPSQYILARKAKQASSLMKEGFDQFNVYPSHIRVVTGGWKTES